VALQKEKSMSDWLHSLPVLWMTLVVFGISYLVAAASYGLVMALAVGERARSFKAMSAGMLPPLGIIFGLFVAFTAAQVWQDNERANTAVDREASALRTVVVLAASLPRETEARLHVLVRKYIEDTTNLEWPMMAQHTATLSTTPRALAEALQVTLAFAPSSHGEEIAQREITLALENALDARRQRILVSQSQVNWVKWSCLIVQAVCALLAIAIVHSDNGLASAIAMGVFATGVAASILLILSHDRPFMGEISITPAPLLQVMPEASAQQRSFFSPLNAG
jgi:hypothetical protein